MVGASAAATEAAMCRMAATTSGTFLPTRSERGPTTSCPTAKPTVVPVRVNCTIAGSTPKPDWMAGNAGKYMSIVNGPSAVGVPSTRM